MYICVTVCISSLPMLFVSVLLIYFSFQSILFFYIYHRNMHSYLLYVYYTASDFSLPSVLSRHVLRCSGGYYCFLLRLCVSLVMCVYSVI